MPLFVTIYDSNGHPDPVASLADVVIDALRTKGVGILRTENHVCEDLRAVIHEFIREGTVIVNQPPLRYPCSSCFKLVAVWHTYPDGHILCTECKDVEASN